MVRLRARPQAGKLGRCAGCFGTAATPSNNLLEVSPGLASEWDHEANGRLTPDQVTPNSARKVVWCCSTCGCRWTARVADRSAGMKACPDCADKQAREASLARTHPDVSSEWHPERNGELGPFDVPASTTTTVWWRCSACSHEWEASIRRRATAGAGCPVCVGKVAAPWRNLETERPDVAADWDRSSNGKLIPSDVLPYSNRSVNWRCATCGYAWRSTVAARSSSSGCARCARTIASEAYNAEALWPELLDTWDPRANPGVTLAEVTPGATRELSWHCRACGLRWTASPNARVRDGRVRGCPACNEGGNQSAIETGLWHELAAFVTLAPRRTVLPAPGRKRGITPDIILPDHRLIIEYDGAYWHRDHTRDEERRRVLVGLGYHVISLREAGLELLGEDDLTIPMSVYRHPYPGKAVADIVLPHLEQLLKVKLTAEGLTVQAYLERDEPVARRGATSDRRCETGPAAANSPSKVALLAQRDWESLRDRGVERDDLVRLLGEHRTMDGVGRALASWSRKRTVRLYEHLGIDRSGRVGRTVRPAKGAAALVEDPQWLHQQYIVQHRTCEDISCEAGVSPFVVRSRLIEFGIPRRHVSDYRRNNSM